MQRGLMSHRRRVVLSTLLASLFSVLASSLHAQFGTGMRARDTLIRGATVFDASGEMLEGHDVLISGKRIKAIGRGLARSRGARVIDGEGKVVIPALIDAAGTIGLAGGPGGRQDASLSVLDRFNSYDTASFNEALSGGVAFAYLRSTGVRRGVGGRGHGVRISVKPGDDRSKFAIDDSDAVHVVVGVGGGSPIVRRLEIDALRSMFEAARKYEESLEKYKEELEKYEKELAEKAKTAGKDKKDGKSDKKKPEGKKDDGEKKKRRDFPRPRRRRRRSAPEPTEPGVFARLIEAAEAERREIEELARYHEPQPIDFAKLHDCDVCGFIHGEDDDHLSIAQAFDYFEFAPKIAVDDSKTKKPAKKAKPTKKPREPRANPVYDKLLEVLEGGVRVRIEVHRAEDILGVLELVEDFPMRVVLEGVTEGYYVADAIAKAKVPVVVAAGPRAPEQERASRGRGRLAPPPFGGIRGRRFAPGRVSGRGNNRGVFHPANAARLHAAGVPLAIGSLDSGTSELLQAAAWAAGHGLPRNVALKAITSHAAKIIGQGSSLGSLVVGRSAGLCLLSGDPFDPTTQIEAVYVDGRRVFKR